MSELADLELAPAKRFAGRSDAPVWAAEAREPMKLALPLAITQLAQMAILTADVLMLGRLSKEALAGADDAVGVRVAGYTALAMSAVFMSVSAAVLAMFPHDISGLYLSPAAPANAEALALASLLLKVAAAFQIFDGVRVTAALSLRGLKGTRMPVRIAGASYWLAGFPVCIGLGVGLGLRGFGVWIGLAFALMVAAICMCSRFAYLSRDRK